MFALKVAALWDLFSAGEEEEEERRSGGGGVGGGGGRVPVPFLKLLY